MYHSVDVAWKMLQLAHEKGIALSNLQLQKLVYIAHGYLLGWKSKPLIVEPIEAWTYGPVVSAIYHQFKSYGDSKIPVSSVFSTELDSDRDAVDTLNGVLSLYGRMTAMDLVNLTHQQDTPWDIAWNVQGGKKFFSHSIDNEIIKNHFRKVISDPKSVGGL